MYQRLQHFEVASMHLVGNNCLHNQHNLFQNCYCKRFHCYADLYRLILIQGSTDFFCQFGLDCQSGDPCPNSKYSELNNSGSKSGFAAAKETNNELKILIFIKNNFNFQMHFTTDSQLLHSHRALSFMSANDEREWPSDNEKSGKIIICNVGDGSSTRKNVGDRIS